MRHAKIAVGSGRGLSQLEGIWGPEFSYACGEQTEAAYNSFQLMIPLRFAKTLVDFEINDIAALPPLFCYDS